MVTVILHQINTDDVTAQTAEIELSLDRLNMGQKSLFALLDTTLPVGISKVGHSWSCVGIRIWDGRRIKL